jgi:flagellar hook assembly protein FlgD
MWQNTPNPFSTATMIRFAIPSSGDVSLSIYDLNGHLVRRLVTAPLPAGLHSVTWDGGRREGVRAAPGVYVCRLNADNRTTTRRVVLIR